MYNIHSGLKLVKHYGGITITITGRPWKPIIRTIAWLEFKWRLQLTTVLFKLFIYYEMMRILKPADGRLSTITGLQAGINSAPDCLLYRLCHPWRSKGLILIDCILDGKHRDLKLLSAHILRVSLQSPKWSSATNSLSIELAIRKRLSVAQ